jgi:molecular chaperone GrpE
VSDELHTDAIAEPWLDATAGEAEASPSDGEGEATASSIPDPLAAVEAERDEYLAALQRVAADFDNYRKRAVRDQQAFAARAAERLVGKLLPVLDDLERALDAAEHHEEAKVVEGVEMTRAALANALTSEGVEEIVAEGIFDPTCTRLSSPSRPKASSPAPSSRSCSVATGSATPCSGPPA